jgi:16S rRNA (uracil1498-N3)-methyltransferase
MPRFHVADLRQPQLTGAQAHHATGVLRLRVGDEVELFDGRGNVARCRIATADKRELGLSVLEQSVSPPLPVRITLAAALIKKNFDFIVQKATELGVSEIIPLITDRTVVRGGRPERWQEIALEACKQCGNNWLPVIHPPQPLPALLAGNHELKLVASLQPGAQRLQPVPVGSVAVAIGPEGDFTPAEYVQLQEAGYQPISLGPLVLRADTAALYALSIVHHELVTARTVC